MLYTVVPLEQIYKKEKGEQNMEGEEKKQKDIALPYGFINTKKQGEHYVVERVISTDMKDYLDEMYFPGQTVSSEIAPWDN